MRTDNDVSKVPYKDEKNLAGINRCMKISQLPPYPNYNEGTTADALVQNGVWTDVSQKINPIGIYLSKVDLESDLALEMPDELKAYSGKDTVDKAVKYIQTKKAIRMREFLLQNRAELKSLKTGELVKPLNHAKMVVEGLHKDV